jgi:hypothetical protein
VAKVTSAFYVRGGWGLSVPFADLPERAAGVRAIDEEVVVPPRDRVDRRLRVLDRARLRVLEQRLQVRDRLLPLGVREEAARPVADLRRLVGERFDAEAERLLAHAGVADGMEDERRAALPLPERPVGLGEKRGDRDAEAAQRLPRLLLLARRGRVESKHLLADFVRRHRPPKPPHFPAGRFFRQPLSSAWSSL